MNVSITWQRLGIVVLALLVACGLQPSASTSHGGPVRDHVSFVDNLRAQGLTVEIVGNVQQPFLRPPGTKLRISGGALTQPAEVESFNYDDTDLQMNGIRAADQDTSQIQPNGTPKTATVTWNGPPHFFRTQRVLVLYVGTDPAVLKLLADTLGPQFAGL